MSQQQSLYEDWFERPVYLDPNDQLLGHLGYWLIGPLLLVFPQVVAHSPVGFYADKLDGRGLTAEELLRAATDRDPLWANGNALRITAFPSFGDADYRGTVGYLNVARTQLDEFVIAQRKSDESRVVWIETDRREINARLAAELVRQQTHWPDAAGLLDRGALQEIADRYQGFLDPDFRPPAMLARYWDDMPDVRHKACLVAVNDCLHDENAMREGEAEIRCLSISSELGVTVAYGIEDVSLVHGPPESEEYVSTPRSGDFGTLLKVLNEVAEVENVAMRWEWISAFRANHRRHFVHELAAILAETAVIANDVQRSLAAAKLAKKRLAEDHLPLAVVAALAAILAVSSQGLSPVGQVAVQFGAALAGKPLIDGLATLELPWRQGAVMRSTLRRQRGHTLAR